MRLKHAAKQYTNPRTFEERIADESATCHWDHALAWRNKHVAQQVDQAQEPFADRGNGASGSSLKLA